ncbi:MAG TPA: hypothetical protein VF251_13530 [Pyrinomonadaceae bacterium]
MKPLATIAVLAHLAVSFVHGYAHQQLGVGLSAWQNYYVIIVITVAPLVALALVWMRRGGVGFALLAISMVGSLIFGAYFHYVGISPDHVSHLPPGDAQGTFRLTAVLLMVIEVFGLIVGVVGFRRER